MTYMVRIKEFHGTDAVYTYTFDNLNDALARVSRFLTPGNLFDERVEVDPTGFKETIRIETIQVWLGEANEEAPRSRRIWATGSSSPNSGNSFRRPSGPHQLSRGPPKSPLHEPQ